MDDTIITVPFEEIPEISVEELPLPVVPDWDAELERAEETCRLIDRHLDYGARRRYIPQGSRFRPVDLCPEQRVQMVTDVAAARSNGG